jgi:endonuclease YncB( thermonuclease family)
MALSDRVSFWQEGSPVLNAFLTLVYLGGLLSIWITSPLLVAFNIKGAATRASMLPGVSADGGIKSGFVMLLYVAVISNLALGAVGAVVPGSPTDTTVSSPQASASIATATITPTPTATPTQSPTQSPTVSPTPSPTPSPTSTATPNGQSVTITEVVDGDTMEIQYRDGRTDTIRLLGVDTPENYTDNSPDEYEGIPDTYDGKDWLAERGDKATAFARLHLGGETVRIATDSTADRRGSYGRLLVYLYVDGQLFNRMLLEEGHARLYESSFLKRSQFETLEQQAQENEVGVWDYEGSTPTPSLPPQDDSDGGSGGSGSLVVASVHEDARGNDHDNLNDEYIVFENTGSGSLSIGGWSVSDEADHTYYVPSGTSLDAGERVTLYTGSGADGGGELYWGSDSAVWNNDGDTITVRDDSGSVVLEHEY